MDAFTLVAKLTLNRSEFDSALAQAEGDAKSGMNTSGFSAWGVAAGQLAAQAFTKVWRGAVDFAKSVITTGMDFDSMMSQVRAVGNMTDEEFEAVRKKAIDLGASTKFTAEEVGEALYYMGLAGWSSEEMLSGISGVLDLAAASGEDLGTVSDIVTDAITAMGLTADDTARFVNVLAAASTNSNTTVAMMGEAFKYLATTGGTLGYTIEDVATVLGLLANNGIKAGQAGTSMRQILNTLIAPSDKAAEAMQALGLSLFEAGTDKRKPLLQVVQELRDIFKGADFDLGGKPLGEVQTQIDELDAWYDEWTKKIAAGDNNYNGKAITQEDLDKEYEAKMQAIVHFNEDFLAKLSAIGGLRGISSLFALMNSTDDDVNQLVEAVTTSGEGGGAAQTMAQTMIDNLEGDITLFNSALDGLKILMSDTYKDPLREFVQTFTEEIGKLSAAFAEGGLAGMFVNLTDWLINGLTDTLSNPEITVDGANKFGEALGDFVGHLISTLITSAPELLSGLFTAGLNLANGLINGLFAGLFGTGEGSVYGLMQNAEEDRDELIGQANATASEAQGIVSYMESLIGKYGEAASKSSEWADAMGRLETLIPGITASIKAEGQELATTTANLRESIEVHRQKAMEDARNKYVGELRSAYEEAQVNLGKAEVERDMAYYRQEAAVRAMAQTYMENRAAFIAANSAETVANQQYNDNLWGFNNIDDLVAAIMNGDETGFSFEDLLAYSGYNTSEREATQKLLEEEYNKAIEEYNKNNTQISELSDSAALLKQQLDLAEAAVARYIESLGTGGEAPKAQAKGDWYVPYDDYPSLLHRGEMVLTASQARRYRNGDTGSGFDMVALQETVAAAVREGMQGASVNAYMDGRKVTAEVSKQMARDMALRR